MMKSNPYIAGNPVGGGEAFIGRADVLRDVLRVLNNPKESGMVLYGQRRIGKTSVLQELLGSLPHKGAYVPVYFDLQDKATKPLDEVLQELTERMMANLNLDSPPGRGEGWVSFFKQTVLPAALAHLAEDAVLVLLFDEFDVMDTSGNQAGSAFFPYLRDLMSFNPQRLKFVFVIGRRPEDLSSLTLSVFKGVKSRHVSLLSSKDTAALVRLSERNESLTWSDEAVAQVFRLTGGHPFLTQQLCQVLWENLYDDDPEDVPAASAADVEQAVGDALKSAGNSLEWLWDGLKPAHRVVASALAEAGAGVISQEQLERCLQESGVRILIGELQDAPKRLAEWDLIRPQDDGYSFPSEMLRRWILERKPLSRVQDEIDRILPVADNLFHAAYGLYQKGDLPQAIPLLQQALGLNPSHLKANQLLAELYLAEGKLNEAQQLLEALFEYQPGLARPRLIQTLLLKAKQETRAEQALALYEQALTFDPNQPEVVKGVQRIYEERGDYAFKAGNFQEALTAYTKAQLPNKIQAAERRVKIEQVYQDGLKELENGALRKAQRLFARVLSVEPTFREAARYMYLAVTGVDPVSRIAELEQRIQEMETPTIAEYTPEDLESLLETEGIEPFPAVQEFKFETITLNERGEVMKRTPGKAQQYVEDLGNGVLLEMVAIPSGTFLMGQSEEEKKHLLQKFSKEDYQKYFARELPQHEVKVNAFMMGKYPVTQAQWEAVMGQKPASFKGAKRPVEQVSWDEAVEFCRTISSKTGQTYRLPSEAEWEYACRAGTTTPFSFGDTITSEFANYNGESTYYAAEPKRTYRKKTTEVGIFPPNTFGLYDMHSNVWEWCQDWFDAEYYKKSPQENPPGPASGSYRVIRGGGWDNFAQVCRSAYRYYGDPDDRDFDVGFRVLRT